MDILEKKLMIVEPVHQHHQYMTMDIKRIEACSWYFNAMYASSDPNKHQELWSERKSFAQKVVEFNDTCVREKKACQETIRLSAKFNEWVHDMNLMKVEVVGAAHTWSRGYKS